MTKKCRLCEIVSEMPPAEIFDESELVLAVTDNFPVGKGHTLIVPKRHIGSFFDSTQDERMELTAMLDRVKARLDEMYQPDAYNIGINDGPAAGQSVPHLHIHLIPRYVGDVENPRGGVRWVIPETAAYWKDK